MTTIVYKDGVMVADKRAYSGDKHPIGLKTKVHRLQDGSLFGCSSSEVGVPEKLRAAVEQEGVHATFDQHFDATAIVVTPEGSLFYFHEGDSFTGPLDAPFIAIGSGDQYAHGALLMGATPKEALQVAMACDAWTGGGIDTIKLRKKPDAQGKGVS